MEKAYQVGGPFSKGWDRIECLIIAPYEKGANGLD
jgi:hypothetical protein